MNQHLLTYSTTANFFKRANCIALELMNESALINLYYYFLFYFMKLADCIAIKLMNESAFINLYYFLLYFFVTGELYSN